MWKFFLLATGEAQVVSSFVLLNIYYILWKKAKRGVSLFLNDSDCIVCSLYVEFRLLWVHCRKGSIHPRWGTVCHHFRSDALIFILSVSKSWHSKTVSKPANKILVTEIFVALVLNSFQIIFLQKGDQFICRLIFILKYLTLFSSAGLKIVFQFSSLELKESEIIISLCPFCVVSALHLPGVFYWSPGPQRSWGWANGHTDSWFHWVQMNPEHVANKAKGFVFLKLESCDKSCVVLYFVGHPVLPLLLESLAQNPCRFQLPGILRKVWCWCLCQLRPQVSELSQLFSPRVRFLGGAGFECW